MGPLSTRPSPSRNMQESSWLVVDIQVAPRTPLYSPDKPTGKSAHIRWPTAVVPLTEASVTYCVLFALQACVYRDAFAQLS